MSLEMTIHNPQIEFYKADIAQLQLLPFVGDISHGFPLPSEDYMERVLSLDEHLIKHPDATILGRVKGDSMIDAGLLEGDVLVIDRSLKVEHGDIGIFRLEGEFLCKRLYTFPDRVELRAANRRFSTMKFSKECVPADFMAIGRVTYIIHKPKRL